MKSIQLTCLLLALTSLNADKIETTTKVETGRLSFLNPFKKNINSNKIIYKSRFLKGTAFGAALAMIGLTQYTIAQEVNQSKTTPSFVNTFLSIAKNAGNGLLDLGKNALFSDTTKHVLQIATTHTTEKFPSLKQLELYEKWQQAKAAYEASKVIQLSSKLPSSQIIGTATSSTTSISPSPYILSCDICNQHVPASDFNKHKQAHSSQKVYAIPSVDHSDNNTPTNDTK